MCLSASVTPISFSSPAFAQGALACFVGPMPHFQKFQASKYETFLAATWWVGWVALEKIKQPIVVFPHRGLGTRRCLTFSLVGGWVESIPKNALPSFPFVPCELKTSYYSLYTGLIIFN